MRFMPDYQRGLASLWQCGDVSKIPLAYVQSSINSSPYQHSKRIYEESNKLKYKDLISKHPIRTHISRIFH